MQPWLVALVVLAIVIVVAAVAWDITKAYVVFGKGFRGFRRHQADEARKREQLHRLTHPDE